jgi:hypothetical protein
MQTIDDWDLSSYLHASNNRAAIIALRLVSMFAVLRTFEQDRDLSNRVESIEASKSDLIAGLWLADTFVKHAIRLFHILPKTSDKNGKGERPHIFFEALPDKFETAEAVEVAKKLDIPERTSKRWLSDWNEKYIKRIKRGFYEKMPA